MPGILNPLTAACDHGYVPDEVWILSNPGVATYVTEATDRFEVITDAYDGDANISVHELEHETDFDGIIGFYRSTIEAAREQEDTIAVDVTPGRKFMSAIAFQAGIQFEADHVFYLYVSNNRFYGRLYPDVPSPVAELVDFQEVFG